MNSEDEIILKADFNYKTFIVDNLKIGDSYLKVESNDIKEIYVFGQSEKNSLKEKLDLLSSSKGFIHLNQMLSMEIDDSIIISLKINRENRKINLKTRVDIENEFGNADKEVMDGIMWAVGYSVDSIVLVYNKLNLYLHLDPETDSLQAIEYGKIDETKFD